MAIIDASVVVERQLASLGGFGAGKQLFQSSGVERAKGHDPRPREQRGVEFERGVFRRRADQRDGAVLHDREETVLLGAIEAMDLVDEQQRAASREAPAARRLENLLEVGDAGKYR